MGSNTLDRWSADVGPGAGKLSKWPKIGTFWAHVGSYLSTTSSRRLFFNYFRAQARKWSQETSRKLFLSYFRAQARKRPQEASRRLFLSYCWSWKYVNILSFPKLLQIGETSVFLVITHTHTITSSPSHYIHSHFGVDFTWCRGHVRACVQHTCHAYQLSFTYL